MRGEVNANVARSEVVPVVSSVPKGVTTTKQQYAGSHGAQGRVVGIATDGDSDLAGLAEDILYVPSVEQFLQPCQRLCPFSFWPIT